MESLHGPCSKINTDILLAGSLSVPISDSIKGALLASRKISSFYTHQAAAIDAIREGKHVIVSTSTASGKSVIYQVCERSQSVRTRSDHRVSSGSNAKIPGARPECNGALHISYKGMPYMK